jgi:hypothetical protein
VLSVGDLALTVGIAILCYSNIIRAPVPAAPVTGAVKSVHK